MNLSNGKKFISHSQHADDYIAWQLLGKTTNGLVIEIGAFDGVHLSNSFSLENLGWKAICVEPNPKIFSFLEKNRTASTNINAAVVSDPNMKTVAFYAEEIGVLSGCVYDEDDVKQRYKNRGLEYKEPVKITVPALTLNSILQSQGVKPEEIDVISIDVEGFEMEVLGGFDLNYYNPALFIIEANTPAESNRLITHFERFKQYAHIGSNRQNLFFIATERVKRKALINLDFENFEAARQVHPFDQKLAIQAVPPVFKQTRAFKYYCKSWLSKLF